MVVGLPKVAILYLLWFCVGPWEVLTLALIFPTQGLMIHSKDLVAVKV